MTLTQCNAPLDTLCTRCQTLFHAGAQVCTEVGDTRLRCPQCGDLLVGVVEGHVQFPTLDEAKAQRKEAVRRVVQGVVAAAKEIDWKEVGCTAAGIASGILTSALIGKSLGKAMGQKPAAKIATSIVAGVSGMVANQLTYNACHEVDKRLHQDKQPQA